MEEMSELMNESFKSIFNEEEDFIEPSNQETQEELRNDVVQKQKIKELLEKVDERKGMGPDGAFILIAPLPRLLLPLTHVGDFTGLLWAVMG
ncbi:hypothetical protein E2C01_007809 [Portunus trituberculatus]|uniref:Uncharacterized protein n=1 Tax=Portunus trituberculatus TaxID=210409 RepID=A0A5B7CZ34_PORTR|nr:hypothetical protein [Portunus trituberculatus]